MFVFKCLQILYRCLQILNKCLQILYSFSNDCKSAGISRKIILICDLAVFFGLHHGFQSLLYITFTHNSVAFKFYIISQANKLRMLFKKSKQTSWP